jgi:hypothetical protein
MFLTATNLYSYLEDVGLASSKDVVDSGLAVSEAGRRNRNFRIQKSAGTSLFVKQVPAVIAETRLSFLREAACSQLAIESPDLAALAAVMPRLVRYDEKQQVLVFELIEDGRSAAETVAQPGGLPDGLIAGLAATLARIHRETMRPGALARVASVMTGEAPWVFIIGDKADQVMPNMSRGCRQVVATIKASPELFHGLALIGSQWRRECLMHGDMKWDNVVICSGPDGSREIRLVDWELANIGDPMWDVAGVMAALLQIWLLGEPAGGAAPVRPAPPGKMPLSRVHQAAARFWQVYSAGFGDGAQAMPELRARLAWMTGARMVLMAFELGQKTDELSLSGQMALELARYFFVDPERALADLLGVSAGAPLASAAKPSLFPWRLEPAEGPAAGEDGGS